MPEIKQSYYLQQALNFTDADLKANRVGRLSKKQIRQILKNDVIVGCVAILIFGVFPILLIILQQQPVLTILMIPLLYLALYFVRGLSRLYDDLKRGEVNRSIAYLQVDKPGVEIEAELKQYFLHAIQDDKLLDVSEELGNLLNESQSYIAYYLPRSQTLLAIEKADRETTIRELKDELKYLESQQASLKAKKGKR